MTAFDPAYRDAFLAALAAAERAAANLLYTLERCRDLLPAEAAGVAALPPEASERLDALGERFARCQHAAGESLRALSLLEAEPHPRFIDILAAMQRRGIIPGLEAWTRQRDLRNLAGHRYLATDADIHAYPAALMAEAPAVAAYAGRIRAYAAAIPGLGVAGQGAIGTR